MTPCEERPLLCFQIPPEVLFYLRQIAINPARARRCPAAEQSEQMQDWGKNSPFSPKEMFSAEKGET